MTEATGDFRIIAKESWGFGPNDAMPCVVCSAMKNWTLHHYRAKGMGGTDDPNINDPSNLLPICDFDHRQVHDEVYRIVWNEGVVVTYDNTLDKIVSRTPWPPDTELLGRVGVAAGLAEEHITFIAGHGHRMIAPELPQAMLKVHEIGKVSERALLQLCHERLERAPRRMRTEAAKALQHELAEAGIHISETMIRSLAGQKEVLEEVGQELWDQTPKSVRVLASWEPPEEGAKIIEAYHDRPKGMTVQAFIEAHRQGEDAKPDPFEESYCESCGGNGRMSEKDRLAFQEVETSVRDFNIDLDFAKTIIKALGLALAVGACPECYGSGRKGDA